MRITFDPPDLPQRLDPQLQAFIRDTAHEMSSSRCAAHGAPPEELKVTPGTGGNLINLEVSGCCTEYVVHEHAS